MDCLTSVLKSIGLFFVSFIFIAAAGAVLIFAGFATARCFGWPEWAGMVCFLAYSVVAIGTFTGVMECQHTREIRRIKAAR